MSDRIEIFLRVIGQFVGQQAQLVGGFVDGVKVGIEQQGVAIRIGSCNMPCADDAAGAGAILDHDGLVQGSAHAVGNHARGQVAAASRGERHDQVDGFAREIIRECGCCRKGACGGKKGCCQGAYHKSLRSLIILVVG